MPAPNVPQYHIWNPEWLSRLEVLEGDASLSGMGLSPGDLSYLRTATDRVVHAAAQVSQHARVHSPSYRHVTTYGHSPLCFQLTATANPSYPAPTFQVNLVFPYNGLHRNNVQATRNILFFCMGGKVKPLTYISTDAVFRPALASRSASQHSCSTSIHRARSSSVAASRRTVWSSATSSH